MIKRSTAKRGMDVLHDPVLNKSTAFTEAERQALGLAGLVPDLDRFICVTNAGRRPGHTWAAQAGNAVSAPIEYS